MNQDNYQWFLEPLNSMTNDAVAGSLAIDGNGTEENYCGITDSDGNIHYVWHVSINLIETMRASRFANSWMNYRIWNRANRNHVLRRCAFLEKPKRRYSPAKTKPRKK